MAASARGPHLLLMLVRAFNPDGLEPL